MGLYALYVKYIYLIFVLFLLKKDSHTYNLDVGWDWYILMKSNGKVLGLEGMLGP